MYCHVKVVTPFLPPAPTVLWSSVPAGWVYWQQYNVNYWLYDFGVLRLNAPLGPLTGTFGPGPHLAGR